MRLTYPGDNGTSLVFGSHDTFVSSTSPSSTRAPTTRNNHYQLLAGDMLDAELDSDPQMSDSELSWQSVTDVDSLTATNHWRGWKQQAAVSSAALSNANHSSLPITSISTCYTALAVLNEGLSRRTRNFRTIVAFSSSKNVSLPWLI